MPGGGMPSMTSAHTEEDLIGVHHAPTPHHSGIDANLPAEPLENLQNDLPPMENMGYDQVNFWTYSYYRIITSYIIEIFCDEIVLTLH